MLGQVVPTRHCRGDKGISVRHVAGHPPKCEIKVGKDNLLGRPRTAASSDANENGTACGLELLLCTNRKLVKSDIILRQGSRFGFALVEQKFNRWFLSQGYLSRKNNVLFGTKVVRICAPKLIILKINRPNSYINSKVYLFRIYM